MAGSFGDYLEDKVLDHVLKTATYTQETNLYMALFTVDPSDSGGGTEANYGSYVRVIHNAWNASSGGSATNNGDITFATSTSGTNIITAFALMTASSGGSLIIWAELDDDRTIITNDTPKFLDTQLTITLA